MTDHETKIIIGSLLHDIGKVVYRKGMDGRKHSQSGYEYLKNYTNDKDILNAVRYHHADALHQSSIEDDSIAYITYIADNIASGADRRNKEIEDKGFEIHTALQPVFNLLNGNKGNLYYHAGSLKDNINYPTNTKTEFNASQYSEILSNISSNLNGLDLKNHAYINSLLEVLEANLSFVPSSTSKKEVADISLYDHVKLTAAFASAIYAYLKKQNITDYKTELYKNASLFYDKKAFLLASLDISGIQKFIYTITTKSALKSLRSRSFYLEIMMEHIIDTLLDKLHLSRANLIYSGGGHCYMILPNTKETQTIFDEEIKNVNKWFLKHFQTALYIAGAYVSCSSKDLQNEPNGSYSALYRELSTKLSLNKSHRYTAAEIIALNKIQADDYERECRVCKRLGKVNEDGECSICESLIKFSKKLMDMDFFSITQQKQQGLPLPGDYYLVSDTEETLKERMVNDDSFVRAYCKNNPHTGKGISTKLWVGDYHSEDEFVKLAEKSKGIKRIAVLRADVDNLGHAFVAGFPDKYMTLSRTATLSRQLSLFFKYHIKSILEKGSYYIDHEEGHPRHAAIVYSGGDDLFIVGAWNDVIELAVDIKDSLKAYTENTLTLSGGIGLYTSSYPISVIADEVADMEDKSKGHEGKNSITLFEDGEDHKEGTDDYISDGTYTWDDFTERVIKEKYAVLDHFFRKSMSGDKSDTERGKAFLYHLLELIRKRNEGINFARFVYLLARMEPNSKATTAEKEAYKEFSDHMYKWYRNEKDCHELKTAINIFVYSIREREE